jgi:hypothetical protein
MGKLTDFQIGCIALVLVAAVCWLVVGPLALLRMALLGVAGLVALYLWGRRSPLAKAAALVITLAVLILYVGPMVLASLSVHRP